ncbi:hypothetical protein [Accumulibacter sp.]|uniref:hypothetical protein n=1 Tax=Accumulibacter sp. TaxID=2053492 RepID=UPI003857AFE9
MAILVLRVWRGFQAPSARFPRITTAVRAYQSLEHLRKWRWISYPSLFPRDLDTHQTMFAMGEAIAHLNRLERSGRLLRSESADGVIRFVRTPAAKEPATGERAGARD